MAPVGEAAPGAGGSAPSASAAAGSAPGARAAPPPGAGLRLPTPRISAFLVLVFLGFGVLLGNVASAPVGGTLASARSPLKVILPATNASVGSAQTAASASEAASSEAAGEGSTPVPEAEPAATPAPAPAPTKTSPAATTKAPSSANTGNGGSGKPAAGSPASKLPAIKHVFVIMLSDESYASVFGPSSTSPYLSQTLEHQGQLLARYDGVAHEELANEVALLSGQGPTVETAANCPNYAAIAPTGTGPDEQVLGAGCVYPASTQTLPGQLQAKQLSWRAYVQGIDEAGTPQGACAHPTLG
ncbi:MAG TPA: hypothetical protein VK655_09605, partial [Solirubrobacteraceae bacterium]|nr:hypothetical protein [Solirubrobacteraceae bacterium]